MAEKTCPTVDEKLAQLVTGLIPEKLPKTKLDELVEKYPRLDNCPLLVAPKCNEAVWHQLKLSTKATDTSLQKCQKLLVAGVCALKADFHSVQKVGRSIFSERFLLKCVKSTTANEICSA